jgi:ACR3 family arsenite transporter
MFKVLSHIQKKLVFYLPLTMALAIIYGSFLDASPLKSFTPLIVFFMVYPMMVVLRYNELLSKGNNKLLIVSQLVNFVIFPIMGYFIGKVFFPDNQYIIIGILLMALLPTSGMTISWTGFAKGNVAAAIKMMVVGLVLGAFLTPFYLGVFVGESANIPFSSIISEIVKVVFIPMALGYTTQKLFIKKYGKETYNNTLRLKIPLVATLALVSIVFISTAMRAKVIVSNPILLVKIVLVLSVSYAFSFLIVTLIARMLFNREDGIALVYGTVMRNLSIALAIALSIFAEAGSEVALIVAVGFVVQIQGAAIYLKRVDKLLGTNVEEAVLN